MFSAYDVETTSKFRHKGKVFSYATCNEQGSVDIRRLDGHPVRRAVNFKHCNEYWSDHRIVKVMHKAKFDLGMTEKLLGKKFRTQEFHDTMLMSHLLRNDHPSHALDDLAWELAGYTKAHDKAIKPYVTNGQTYDNAPELLFNNYQKADVERTMLLFLFFWPKIQENADWLECYDYEKRVLPITNDMEDRGLMLHKDKCLKLIEKLKHDADSTMDEIEYETGERMTPQSDKFKWYLFEKLKLPVLTKTKTGKPGTDKDTMLLLAEKYPRVKVISLAQRYGSWARGVTTLTKYMTLADDEGFLHPNISTCQAITGREAASDPNLMNVEKTGVLKNPYPIPARTVFRPRPGYVNFHIDFSGQEMRVLIHYSGDDILVKIANEHGDLHLPATLIFYGDRYRNGSPELQKTLRDASKNANFAIAYGAAFLKVAETLNLTASDAFRARSEYVQTFPRLVGLMPTVMAQIRQNGYVETAFGRRLYIPRDQAYVGVNYLGQGTGAEMIKRAQVKVDDYLNRETGGEMALLMPIHDELIIQCPRKMLGYARPVLQGVAKRMTDFGDRFRVPFEVEVKVATYDWAHKEKYNLWN